MANYTDNPKVLRLREVFRELNYRSYNAFAEDLGTNQPTVSNYVQGRRVPTAEFFLLVLKKFPQYNQAWLMDGEGEKYNPEYVEVNMNGHNTISGNSNGGDNIIGNNNKNVSSEIKELYSQLVESLRSQIKTLEKNIEILARENDMLRNELSKREKKES